MDNYWPGIHALLYFIVLQYSRNVSQSRWIIDDERMGEASVEVLPQWQSDRLSYFCLQGLTPFCCHILGNFGKRRSSLVPR